MKNKLINFFREPWNLCCLIGCIIGVIYSVGCFHETGAFKAPTEEDFRTMHEKEEKILEDFENIYSLEKIKISINDEHIIVDIYAEETTNYLVRSTFSKEKDLISSQEISNKRGFRYYPENNLFDLICVWVIALGVGMLMGGVLIGVLLQGIYSIVKYAVKKLKMHKVKQ